jgi:hypothetical protein
MVKAFPQKLVDSMIEQTPMGRMASADELASMVAWMCSSDYQGERTAHPMLKQRPPSNHNALSEKPIYP